MRVLLVFAIMIHYCLVLQCQYKWRKGLYEEIPLVQAKLNCSENGGWYHLF